MKGTSRSGVARAVSPVIGVLLMVAITVILAATIGTFALDFSDDVSANPQASVIFDEDGSQVTVTVEAVQRADSMEITGDCGTKSLTPEAGNSKTVTCSSGDVVRVTATYQGHTVIVKDYEYQG